MKELEATKLIDDLGEGLVGGMIHHLQDKIKTKRAYGAKRAYGDYNGADVYKIGDTETGYIVLAKDDEIFYFVRYKRVRHNALGFGRQVLVWRNKDEPQSAGFALEVFNNYLLPKFTALISDTLQTSNGFRFWQFAIDDALKHGRYVYFLDRRSTPNRLIQLHSMPEVAHYKDDIWGHSEGHKRTFAVISLKSLALERR